MGVWLRGRAFDCRSRGPRFKSGCPLPFPSFHPENVGLEAALPMVFPRPSAGSVLGLIGCWPEVKKGVPPREEDSQWGACEERDEYSVRSCFLSWD